MSRVTVRAETKGSEVNVFPERSDDAEVAELLRDCLESLVRRFRARWAAIELSTNGAFDWASGGVAVVKSINAIEMDGQVLVDLAGKEVQYSIVVDIEGGEKRQFTSRNLAMPGHATPTQIAALEADNARLRGLLEAERAKVKLLQQLLGNAAQQPRESVPLPAELDEALSEKRIAAFIKQGITGHQEIHRIFDDAMEKQKLGPQVLQSLLQRYLDELTKADLMSVHKKIVVGWLSRTSSALGLRFKLGEAKGTLSVYGSSERGSLRLQSWVDGERVLAGLGVRFPEGLQLVPAPPPAPKGALGLRKRLSRK